MDYQGFTNDSLVKMYEGVREALADDEAFREIGGKGRISRRRWSGGE
jgi:ribosomal protein L20A (L18A)